MRRRWELILLITACLLVMAAGCRTQLPAEFSRMGETGLNSPAPSPGGGLDAGAPLAGEQDALANPDVEQEQEPEVTTGGRFVSDALYAIPQQTSAAVGEAVRIVVATGVTAHPFQYMNSVRVTFSAGEPSFVSGSYNVGALGGSADHPDGIWASVNPEDFLLPNDYMLSFNNYDAAGGRWAMDFNVTPILGTAVEGTEGELFNFEVTFAQPGTARLGFEQFRDVDRTYYSYSESRFGSGYEHYWSDLSNDHAGSANTIVVN
jgi:hypothetical protein